MARWKTESELIRALIKRTRWEERQYIEDLRELEDFITKENCEMRGIDQANRVQALMDAYPDEYATLLREFRPDQYKRFIDVREARRRFQLMSEQERMAREDVKSRLEWMAMGGRP